MTLGEGQGAVRRLGAPPGEFPMRYVLLQARWNSVPYAARTLTRPRVARSRDEVLAQPAGRNDVDGGDAPRPAALRRPDMSSERMRGVG